ncbi:penicillin-binding transpeptidase domain-containing protein [Thermocatellispora tengchongensis]
MLRMANRRLVALLAAAGAIVAFGVYGLACAPGAAVVGRPEAGPSEAQEEEPESAATVARTPSPSPSPTPTLGAREVAAAYFAAWQVGDLAAMAGMVTDAPGDFVERHRRFDADLRVRSLLITPGALRENGPDSAEMPFEGVREVDGLGRWPFSSVLRLGRRTGAWKVVWAPETMHPSLAGGGGLKIVETPVRRPATLTMEGTPFPRDSRAGDYVTGLDGMAVDLALEEEPSGKVLLQSPAPTPATRRTTISQPVQAAAARALDGLARRAAIVAVDVGSREVRAVADTLGGKGAFNGLYPPGSTFKTVTAAALLRTGLTADSPVACPATYTLPNGRTFTNADATDHGTVSLAAAFALSCNTTFAQQAYERLQGDLLRAEAAGRFGFRVKPGLSSCRIAPAPDADALGADAIGQNSVQASPLCMAEVAAAVASGVWRPASMGEPGGEAAPEVPLDEGMVAGLRAMMRAVVTEGTAARVGLPPGTAGKTGTAEVAGQQSHGWFIGYRGTLAFAVFVQNGGSGASSAAPIAAKFLKAL